MATQFYRKTCSICGTIFARKKREGMKKWENRKVCSIECSWKYLSKIHKEKHFAPQTEYKRGHVFSQKTLEKMSQAKQGEKHNFWKGGLCRSRGRYYLYIPEHPRANKKHYVRRARVNMEKFLGRYLNRKEVVHHINYKKDDDRIENLQLFATNREHSFFHARNKKLT